MGCLAFFSHKHLKTPVQIQYNAADCGVTCLSILLEFYQAPVNYFDLKQQFHSGIKGASLDKIASVAAQYGLMGQKKIYTLERLQQVPIDNKRPVIILMDHQHFMLFEAINGNKIYLNDPMLGRVVYSEAEFLKHFSCVGLLLEPTDQLTISKSKPFIWQVFKQPLLKNKSVYCYISCLFFLSIIPAVVSANYTHIFVDFYLVRHQHDMLIPLLSFICLFLILQISIQACQHFMMKKLQVRLNIDINRHFLRHLFGLPLQFFATKPVGDVVNIINSNTELAFQLSSRLLMSLLAIVQCVIFILVMLGFSPLLTLIVLLTFCLTFLVSYCFRDHLLMLHTVFRGQQATYYAMTMNIIDMLPSIQRSGRGSAFFRFWFQAFTGTQQTQQQLALINRIIQSLTQGFLGINALLLISVGSFQVIDQQLSLGALLGFILLAGLLHGPISALSRLFALLVSIRVNVDRLQSVLAEPRRQQTTVANQPVGWPETTVALTFEKLRIGYDSDLAPLITIPQLGILPGEKIAIVGKSGAGKSTLLNAIRGLTPVMDGQISLMGQPIESLSEKEKCQLIAFIPKLHKPVTTPSVDRLLGVAMSDLDLAAPNVLAVKSLFNARDLGAFGSCHIQKLALNLAQSPKLLLLDEPDDQMDTKMALDLIKRLQTLPQTLLMITHNMQHLKHFDRIIWIHNHQITCAPFEESLKDNAFNAFISGNA